MYALDATMSKSSSGIGSKLLGIGTTAAIMAGVVGAASVKMAADFEKNISKTGALVGASKARMESWSETILDMSAKGSQSAGDLGDAWYFAVSNMPDATDAQRFETLAVAEKGAVGGVANLEDAIRALTTVQNAYTGSSVALQGPIDYMDAMNVAVRRGSFTLQELVSNMGKVTGTAAIAGVSFTELGAAAATLTRKGVPVETTFMALNQTLMTFLKPTAEASKTAERLGIDFSLAGLRSKGLAGALMEIAEKVPDDELTSLFPNIRALKAVLPLAGISMKEFAADLSAMGDRAGVTNKMFETMSETASYKFAQAMNTLKKSVIELGQKLLPVATKIATAIGNIFAGKNETVNAFAGAVKKVGGTFVNLAQFILSSKIALVSLIGAFAAFKLAPGIVASISGLFSQGVASLGGSLLPAVINNIRVGFIGGATAAQTMATSVGGLSMAMASAALVAAPFVALIGGLIYAAWKASKEGDRAFAAVRKNDMAMGEAGKNLAVLSGRYQDLRDKLAGMTPDTEGYTETQSQLKATTAELASAFPEMVAGYDNERQAIMASDEVLKEHINNLMKYSGIQGVSTTGDFAGLEATIKQMSHLSEVREKVSSGIDGIVGSLQNLNLAGFDASSVMHLLSTDFKAGQQYIKDYLSYMQQTGQVTKDSWARDPYHAINDINNAVKELGLTVDQAGGSLQYLDSQMNQLAIDAAKMKDSLIQAAYNAGLAGKGISQNIADALRSTSSEFRQFGANAAAATAAGMLAMRGVTGDEATKMAQDIANLIASGADYPETGSQIGREVYDSIKQQMKDMHVEITADTSQVDAAKEKSRSGWSGVLVPSVDMSEVTAAKTSAHQGWGESHGQLTADDSDVRTKKEQAKGSWWAQMVVRVSTAVNPVFSKPKDAGIYIAEQLTAGAGSVNPTVTIGAGAANIQELDKVWNDLVNTTLVFWSENGERERWDKMRIAIQSIFADPSGAFVAWTNMNDALKRAQEELKGMQEQSDKYDDMLYDLNKSLNKVTDSINAHQSALDKLGQTKIKGQTSADNESFQMQQESNKLQLAIMKAEDAHNYELAAQLTLKKEALDHQKEEYDLATSIKYDPMTRKLEQMLDPMYNQEKTWAQITKEVKAHQTALAPLLVKQANLQKSIAGVQEKQADLNRTIIDTQAHVSYLQQRVDDMASAFISRFDEMKSKADELKRSLQDIIAMYASGQLTGGGMGSFAYGGPVHSTGQYLLHAGEFVLSKSMLRGLASPRINQISVSTGDQTVFVPVYLDGRQIATSVSRIQGQQSSARARSGGRY